MEKTIKDKVETGSPSGTEGLSVNMRITIIAGVAVIIAIIYLAYLSQKRFEETMVSQTQQQLLAVAEATAKNIEEFTAKHLSVLNFIAKDPSFHKRDHQEPLLKNLYENYETDVDAICLVDAEGAVLYRYPFWTDGKDRCGCIVTEQSELITASRERSPYSKVSYNEAGQLSLYLSVPMSQEGKFSGILRWMIRMDTISKRFIEPIKVGQKGYGWLLDNNKMILAHPNSKNIGTSYIALKKEEFPDQDWSELETVVEKMAEGKDGIGVYHSSWWGEDQLERVKMLTAYTPVHIGNNAWSIIVSMSYSEITGPINKNGLITFVLSGLIILLFGTGGVLLFRTERRKAELTVEGRHLQKIAESAEALRESEKRYRTLVETIPDGILEFDKNGIIIFANDALYRLVGYGQQELVGRSVFDFMTEDSTAKELRDYIEKALKEQASINPWEGKVLTKEGNVIDIRVHWNYRRDERGNIEGFISLISDITAQKRTEKALQKSHEELEKRVEERTNELMKEKKYTESILKAMVDTLIVIGPENRIKAVNDVTLNLLGYGAEELIGGQLQKILKDELEGEKFEELIEQGRLMNLETFYTSKDGGKIPVLFSAVGIRDHEDNITSIVCTAKDITELKNLQESLLNFQELLRTLASKQLSVQEQERKKISLELHDDLGQILTAVLIDIAQAAQRCTQGNFDCHGVLGRIQKGAEEALQRVRNIAYDLRPGILDSLGLQAAVEALLEDFRERTGINVIEEVYIENHGISEHVTIAIYRILQESLTNAVKYAAAKEIIVELKCSGNNIMLSITDDGQGFDTRSSFMDKGLGLLGMKERTEWLSGVFRIESTLGRGTKVHAKFPLSS